MMKLDDKKMENSHEEENGHIVSVENGTSSPGPTVKQKMNGDMVMNGFTSHLPELYLNPATLSQNNHESTKSKTSTQQQEAEIKQGTTVNDTSPLPTEPLVTVLNDEPVANVNSDELGQVTDITTPTMSPPTLEDKNRKNSADADSDHDVDDAGESEPMPQ